MLMQIMTVFVITSKPQHHTTEMAEEWQTPQQLETEEVWQQGKAGELHVARDVAWVPGKAADLGRVAETLLMPIKTEYATSVKHLQ
jgi:hypothetical protein